MSISQTFHEIERTLGVRFSPLFYEFLSEFLAISTTPDFNRAFGDGHFCSESEIRDALDDFLPQGFIPFFVVERRNSDYYCFESENPENRSRLVVFCRDAIVFQWDNYMDFLAWIRKNLALSPE